MCVLRCYDDSYMFSQNLLITKFRLVEKIGSKVVFSKETCAELVEVKGLIDELMTNSPDAKVCDSGRVLPILFIFLS